MSVFQMSSHHLRNEHFILAANYEVKVALYTIDESYLLMIRSLSPFYGPRADTRTANNKALCTGFPRYLRGLRT